MGHRPDGKAIRVHRSAKTRAEVVAKVEALTQVRREGGYRPTSQALTLGRWLEQWLTIIEVTRRPKTHATYSSHMRKHVIPVLGARRLAELDTESIEGFYLALRHTGASPHTVHAVHRELRSALNMAVQRKHLAWNPVTDAAVQTPDEEEVQPLGRDEIRRVLVGARERRNGSRFAIALALGLRQGEALGLQARSPAALPSAWSG